MYVCNRLLITVYQQRKWPTHCPRLALSYGTLLPAEAYLLCKLFRLPGLVAAIYRIRPPSSMLANSCRRGI